VSTKRRISDINDLSDEEDEPSVTDDRDTTNESVPQSIENVFLMRTDTDTSNSQISGYQNKKDVYDTRMIVGEEREISLSEVQKDFEEQIEDRVNQKCSSTHAEGIEPMELEDVESIDIQISSSGVRYDTIYISNEQNKDSRTDRIATTCDAVPQDKHDFHVTTPGMGTHYSHISQVPILLNFEHGRIETVERQTSQIDNNLDINIDKTTSSNTDISVSSKVRFSNTANCNVSPFYVSEDFELENREAANTFDFSATNAENAEMTLWPICSNNSQDSHLVHANVSSQIDDNGEDNIVLGSSDSELIFDLDSDQKQTKTASIYSIESGIENVSNCDAEFEMCDTEVHNLFSKVPVRFSETPVGEKTKMELLIEDVVIFSTVEKESNHGTVHNNNLSIFDEAKTSIAERTIVAVEVPLNFEKPIDNIENENISSSTVEQSTSTDVFKTETMELESLELEENWSGDIQVMNSRVRQSINPNTMELVSMQTDYIQPTNSEVLHLNKTTTGGAAQLCETTKFATEQFYETTTGESAQLNETINSDSEQLPKITKGGAAQLDETTIGGAAERDETTKGSAAQLDETTECAATQFDETIKCEVSQLDEATNDEARQVAVTTNGEAPQVGVTTNEEARQFIETTNNKALISYTTIGEAQQVNETTKDEAQQISETTNHEARQVNETTNHEARQVNKKTNHEARQVNETTNHGARQVSKIASDEAVRVDKMNNTTKYAEVTESPLVAPVKKPTGLYNYSYSCF